MIPTYEHVLAKQIIILNFQFIATKANQFTLYHLLFYSPALQTLGPNHSALQPLKSQPIKVNNMSGILTEHIRQISNLYLHLDQPNSALVSNFHKIKYFNLFIAVLYLDQALSVARLDCEQDLYKQLIESSGAAKMWITIQVEYERVNPLATKLPFEQYISAAQPRIIKRNEAITALKTLIYRVSSKPNKSDKRVLSKTHS